MTFVPSSPNLDKSEPLIRRMAIGVNFRQVIKIFLTQRRKARISFFNFLGVLGGLA